MLIFEGFDVCMPQCSTFVNNNMTKILISMVTTAISTVNHLEISPELRHHLAYMAN